jgi:RNA polymerase sigma factor (sigma-70 family)
MDDDERSLIERAQMGDEGALVELYHHHYASVHSYLAFRLGDAATADDLTSDVFVRMVRHLDSFRWTGRPLRAWLYTIARNLLTEHYRYDGHATHEPLHEGLHAREVSPEAALAGLQSSQALLRALGTLSESQQEVIIARFIEGCSIAEAALLLDRSPTAIKALQHRALASLRRALEKEEQR